MSGAAWLAWSICVLGGITLWVWVIWALLQSNGAVR
jgi:hypothetical protein